jgi:hypothetical protein
MTNFIEVKVPHGITTDKELLTPNHSTVAYLQDTGGVQVDCATSATQSLRAQTTTAADLRPAGQNNVMSSARTPWGSPISDPSKINNQTIITVKGISAEIGQALQAGIVVKNADGTYSEAASSATQVAKAQAAKQQAATKKVDIFTPGNRKNLAGLQLLMGSTAVEGILAKASASLAFKDGDATGVARVLADAIGLDPATSESIIDGIMMDVQNFGIDYLTAQGVDGEAAFEWMFDNTDPVQRANLLNALCFGDVSMLGWLAEQYRLSGIKKA